MQSCRSNKPYASHGTTAPSSTTSRDKSCSVKTVHLLFHCFVQLHTLYGKMKYSNYFCLLSSLYRLCEQLVLFLNALLFIQLQCQMQSGSYKPTSTPSSVRGSATAHSAYCEAATSVEEVR